MTGIQIHWDSRGLTTWLDDVTQKQIPFATALALTRTGQKIKAEERATVSRVFDRPTPWTLNSLMLKPATKQKPEANVWFKDQVSQGTPAGSYLLPEVYGGERSHFRFEGALRAAGVLGRDEYAIPASGAPRNAYGNLNRGIYGRVLSDLGAGGKEASGTARIFVGTVGRAHGIFQATGKDAKLLFVFTTKVPAYRKRFPFFDVAAKVQESTYQEEFTKALDEAIRTAK